ncbi:unnamed protein product [Cuscuta campestris]|uniref:Uncharacterized protein n=1 Tax=Cuscuta campestris TaxID=132261 RepID=A0A484MMA3_9ASTE|nr:unnamed protein product [Cuscuta campestris]
MLDQKMVMMWRKRLKMPRMIWSVLEMMLNNEVDSSDSDDDFEDPPNKNTSVDIPQPVNPKAATLDIDRQCNRMGGWKESILHRSIDVSDEKGKMLAKTVVELVSLMEGALAEVMNNEVYVELQMVAGSLLGLVNKNRKDVVQPVECSFSEVFMMSSFGAILQISLGCLHQRRQSWRGGSSSRWWLIYPLLALASHKIVNCKQVVTNMWLMLVIAATVHLPLCNSPFTPVVGVNNVNKQLANDSSEPRGCIDPETNLHMVGGAVFGRGSATEEIGRDDASIVCVENGGHEDNSLETTRMMFKDAMKAAWDDAEDTFNWGKLEVLKMLANFLDQQGFINKAACIRELDPKRIGLPWRDAKQVYDYGVATMRHMETYMGEGAKGCDYGLSNLNHKPLLVLRKKYCAVILLHKVNEMMEMLANESFKKDKVVKGTNLE